LAGALQARGLEPGDRVAVIGPNCHRFVELYLTVPGAGMVLVPLNARHTIAELRYALEDSGTKVVFSGMELGELTETFDVIRFAEYDELIADAEPLDLVDDIDESALAGLFYTGGTTGASKGVMLTHRNLIANTLHFAASMPFTSDTTWLVAAPMFHAAGSVAILPTVWAAGHQVILPAFHPAGALALIEEHRATVTVMVPTMVAAMTEEQRERPRDVTSLRMLGHGGSPIATETVRRTHETFPLAELIHVYGATETAPLVTMLRGEELLLDDERIRSCGQPVMGVDMQVVDGDGRPRLNGMIGEVVVRGANVMAGYWNKPVETAAALVNGTYRTGDMGYRDHEGYLYLVDRAKDMIITGGENVYSTEVEDALYKHPAVLEAAVYGIPHERWGEAVHASVVPRVPVGTDELIEHVRRLIAGYKVPKSIEIRTAPLPKSGAGKILKRELRDRYWTTDKVRVGGA
jgi:long-chain acyl-CoA synthetase